MKLSCSAKIFAIFVLAAVLAAGLIVAEDSAMAQTSDPSGSSVINAAGAVSGSGGAGVAAVPLELPLAESDLVGSVMYRRTGQFERFDTDHDIDPSSGAGGASGASGSSSDREIIGSHYLLGDTFNVRVPTRYAGKPADVFGFSFNHLVFQAGGGRFTADCDNQRVFAYRDSGAARWRCDLDFGNSAPRWGQAVASAAQVSVGAAWSDEGCKGDGAFGISKEEPLLVADCRALLGVKHHWLDGVEGNEGLPSSHALRSWGSGDIGGWGGVRVGGFHMTSSQFKDNCVIDVEEEETVCPRRVLGVDLSAGRDVEKISGSVPVELGGFESSDSRCSEVKSRRLFGVGFAGVGCGLGALQVLDLGGNSLGGKDLISSGLDGGIPWQLGNVGVAPCNPSVAISKLDIDSSIALGLLLLSSFAFPVSGVLGVSLSSLGVAVGIGGAFVDVDVDLDEYLFGCSEASEALSRRLGTGSGGGGAAFERARFQHQYNAEVVERGQYDEFGEALFPSVLLGFESAGASAAGVADDALLEIKVGDATRSIRAGAIKAAGRAAGFVGAVLDVNDIVSDLYSTKEREFLHLDRSQLQFLDLSGNQLAGSVPEEIGNLESLEYLYLNDNSLSGSIPGDAGRGARAVHDRLVHLNLSNNSFSGVIPFSLSTQLRAVDLSGNNLSGSVPSSLVLLFGLYHLDLSGNRLSGELPVSIANMPSLEVLYLQSNSLSGMVPSEIGKLHRRPCVLILCWGSDRISTDRLRHINISRNSFHGQIPDNLGNLSELALLDLQHNCFSGNIPKSLTDKSRTGSLSLKYEYNSFAFTKKTTADCGPCFDGTYMSTDADEDLKGDCVTLLGLKNHWGRSFPHRWGEAGQKKISTWEGVAVSGNRVTGLELPNLGLSGALPDILGDLEGLASLRLDGNRLTGGIPLSFSKLSDLKTLNLSNNMLSGEIPDDVGGWSDLFVPNLTDLNLSHNMFSGEIPVGIGHRLTSLVNLNLSHNRLTGPIPGYLSNDRDSVWNVHELFDGRIAIANLQNLEFLDLSHNLLTGKIPGNIVTSSHIYKNTNLVPYGGNLEDLLLHNNCLTIDDNTDKEIRDAGIFLKVENNPSEAGCADGCSGGVLVADPSRNPGLVSDCETLLTLSEHWPGSAAVGIWGQGRNKNINRWQGVTVAQGRVVKLELPDKGLSGNIPQQIARLSRLQVLNLSDNTLSGEIPRSLRYLERLQILNLADNQISGNIPTELGRLSSLTSLKLQNNKLTGAIPAELAGISGFSNIAAVNLSANCLLGPVPAALARVTLARGNLFGTANDNPDCANPCSDGTFVPSAPQVAAGVVASPLIDDCRALWAARKHWNSLNQNIRTRSQQWGTTAYQDITTWPGVTVRQNRVREIDLSAPTGTLRNRKLRGTIPAALLDLPALEVLNLSGNRLRGEIPRGLHRLDKLKTLNLSRNLLSGPAPTSLGRLRDLLTLDLSYNKLTGQAPSVTTRISTSTIPALALPDRLGHLYLNNNEFEGIIPPQITSHANLKALRLSNNNLNGHIPASIVSLGLLFELRLDGNNLTGPAPEGLQRMVNLRYLYLQNNCLTGQDPGPALRNAFLYYRILLRDLRTLRSSPVIRTHNNLFDNTASENKSCGQICRDSVANPSVNTELLQDCETLLAIRDKWAAQTTLPEGSAMATWGSSEEAGKQHQIDRWQGITVTDNRVTGLNLTNHALTSPAPPELASLKALTSLNLSNNQLDTFPAQILELDKLQNLNLGSNQITTLPANINNLEDLASLNLSNNDIAVLPASISELELLTELNLAENRLNNSRTRNLNTIATLKSLNHLNLSSNRLTGTIPTTFRKLTNLTHLHLNDNQFYGSIPAYISNLTQLQHLDLSSNSLSGSIPPQIDSLRNLRSLHLGDNRLSGSIPPQIGNLRNLRYLHLGDNRLSGSIPPEIDNLRNLRHLYLARNRLSGSIPQQIVNLRNLERLVLSINRLSGRIPYEIGNLSNLKRLDLSINRLSGKIPRTIGNLRNLEYLYLGSNRFHGFIPLEMRNLTKLRAISLWNDRLSCGQTYILSTGFRISEHVTIDFILFSECDL